MSKPSVIRCVETGQVFSSRAEIDREFGWVKGTASKILRGKLKQRPGHTIEEDKEPEVTHDVTVTKYLFEPGSTIVISDGEVEVGHGVVEIKQIPGYEGLYSITSEGVIYNDRVESRFQAPTIEYSGAEFVALYKNHTPHVYQIKDLLNAAFSGKPLPEKEEEPQGKLTEAESFAPDKPARKSIIIKCLEDEEEFKSIKACCEYYGLSYRSFVQACKKSGGQPFVYKSRNTMPKEFQVLLDEG